MHSFKNKHQEQKDFTFTKDPSHKFLKKILEGFQKNPKTLFPDLLYDTKGSLLFSQITQLPEYYLTRHECSLLEKNTLSILKTIDPSSVWMEFGSGDGKKMRPFFSQLQKPITYFPTDLSSSSLKKLSRYIKARYPLVHPIALCEDFLDTHFFQALNKRDISPSFLIFLGSTFSNLSPKIAKTFLAHVFSLLPQKGYLLLGVDLEKSKILLEKAYNDPLGLNAAFCLNVISRLQKDFSLPLQVQDFRYKAKWNHILHRMEMQLICQRTFHFSAFKNVFSFQKGELLYLAHAYKYTPERFKNALENSGFSLKKQWFSAKNQYLLALAQKVPLL